ncbi:cytochrome b subunit of succinate dehydrogenase, Sdh3p, partial [Spiromyces aspiralis]
PFIATPKVYTTSTSTETKSQTQIANAARANRPVSPHLSIYQPQLTWYLSSAHRLTGVTVVAATYLGCISYGIAALTGAADMSSATVASALATSVPGPILLALKALISSCFSFHTFNGIRHLIWDTGRELALKGVYRTGYATLAATALATTYLTFF